MLNFDLDHGVYGAISAKVVVFYHKNCPDGCTAAWVVGLAHESDCHFIPVMHCEMDVDDDRIESCKGKDVYMVDTYQSRKTLNRLNEICDSVTIIDHHASGQCECDGVEGYVYSDSVCGSMMAWRMFFDEEPPKIVKYVNDMDMWENSLEDTKAIQMELRKMRSPDAAGKMSQRMEFAWDLLVKSGRKKLSAMNKCIGEAIEDSSGGTINGVQFVCYESRRYRDDIGMALAERFSMPACVWSWQGDQFTYSLRSVDGGVDVIAEAYGGGGHSGAAGFASERQVIIDVDGNGMVSTTKTSKRSPAGVRTHVTDPRQENIFGNDWRARVYGGKR